MPETRTHGMGLCGFPTLRCRWQQSVVIHPMPPVRPHCSLPCPHLWTTLEGEDGSKRWMCSRLGTCLEYFPPLLDLGSRFPAAVSSKPVAAGLWD